MPTLEKEITSKVFFRRDHKIRKVPLDLVHLSPAELQRQLLSKLAPEISRLRQFINQLWRFMFIDVDFDTDPNGNALADGTQLDTPGNPYSSLGLTFSAIPGPLANAPLHVWIRRDPEDAISPPNVISLVPPPSAVGESDEVGTIRISFDAPRSSVSIQARVITPPEYLGPPGPTPYIKAFDSANNLIAAASIPSSQVPKTNCATSAPVTLSVSSDTATISYVECSCGYDPNYEPLVGVFDSLQFTRV